MASRDLAAWRDWSSSLESLDLGRVEEQDLDQHDIVGKLITGSHSNITFHRNFQRCAFRNAALHNLSWQRVDYKDTVFVSTEFSEAKLESGSTVSCTFADCQFTKTSWRDAAIHDCFFQRCSFVDCDFQSAMMRNCQLVDCRFERCVTSNKLFEGCKLFSNDFIETALDFRAVIDNFGVDSRQLPLELVRTDRSYPKVTPFQFAERIGDSNWLESLSAIEMVKLQYYLSGGELLGNDSMDLAFQPGAWATQALAPVNLAHLLQDFSEFLLRLYELDKLPAIFVLRLAQLAESIQRAFSEQDAHAQLTQAGAGVYYRCLRWLADLEYVVSAHLPEGSVEKVVLRSTDDADDEAIADIAHRLTRTLGRARIEILPRNSPVDIVISGLSYGTSVFLVTMFFSTKTRFELSKFVDGSTSSATPADKPLFSMIVGGARKENLESAFSIQSRLPGSLLFRLDVEYSLALVEKIKKTISSVLT